MFSNPQNLANVELKFSVRNSAGIQREYSQKIQYLDSVNSNVQFGNVPRKMVLFRNEIGILQVVNSQMVCNLPKLEILDRDNKPLADLASKDIQSWQHEKVKFQFKPFFPIAVQNFDEGFMVEQSVVLLTSNPYDNFKGFITVCLLDFVKRECEPKLTRSLISGSKSLSIKQAKVVGSRLLVFQREPTDYFSKDNPDYIYKIFSLNFPDFTDSQTSVVSKYIRQINFYDGIYRSFTMYNFANKLYIFYRAEQ